MGMSMNLCGIIWNGGSYQTIPIAGYIMEKPKFRDDPRFRSVDLQFPYYLDYCAILAPEEAMEFVADCGYFLSPENRQQCQDGMRDAILKSTFVLAHIFEV
jgi:hypothetical protein